MPRAGAPSGRAHVAGVSLLLALATSNGCSSPPPSTPTPTPTPPVPPAVTSVAPSAGFVGVTLLVTGTGFQQGLGATLGGVNATVVTVTESSFRLTVPPHAEGVVDLVVSSAGQNVTFPRAFTYQQVTLTATPTSVQTGDSINVSWVAPPGRGPFDWVGIFKVGESSENYTAYFYADRATTGTVTFIAPAVPGQYEFRYLLDDGYLDVARAGPVNVTTR